MDWENLENRMLLARLYFDRSLRKNKSNHDVIEYLLNLGWIVQTPRVMEVEVTETGLNGAPLLLNRLWPQWKQVSEMLKKAGLPLSVKNLKKIERQKLTQAFKMPKILNKKTLAALFAEHSKATPDNLPDFPDVTVTTDDLLRLRANKGLILTFSTGKLYCDTLMDLLGEVIIPERAFLDGITVEGIFPKVIMTVENLGAFVDLPKPQSMLAINSPGWNSLLTCKLLATFPQNINYYHFGDLDPEGLDIAKHLEEKAPQKLRHFIPGFWQDYIKTHSQKLNKTWPSRFSQGVANPMIKKLIDSQCWLEQECILADSRLFKSLADLCNATIETLVL